MNKSISIALILFANLSQAAEYSQYFATESGQKLSQIEALESSTKGSQVYRCQSVEAKVSKSGTSIALHNVKKPKTK